ncbi:MAG TPA: MqnA/MqnD/SBP family protein [Candidatus Polarisedimenticolaceae bacterium]|nr:MqnA/MqnD/SBP family protein [Candidatus Polarisedimenticolaceae bacterium]
MSVLTRRIRIGHSPDPDDAFMYYAIARSLVDTGGHAIEQVLEDIESLNRRALVGELEVTAVSIHAYAHLADRYALMSCGASMGDGYGPIVVAKEPLDPAGLAGVTVAIPGTLTSAYLALRLFTGREFPFVVVPFDQILDAVTSGQAGAGLVIHEGQLTYAAAGLKKVLDLGAWWKETHDGLPLPLGGNAVRKDLGAGTMRSLTAMYRGSIAYALAHRGEALAYAKDFGRGLSDPLNDRFVGMYVNDLTLDYGERGRRAIRAFLDEGAAAGLVPSLPAVDFVG